MSHAPLPLPLPRDFRAKLTAGSNRRPGRVGFRRGSSAPFPLRGDSEPTAAAPVRGSRGSHVLVRTGGLGCVLLEQDSDNIGSYKIDSDNIDSEKENLDKHDSEKGESHKGDSD